MSTTAITIRTPIGLPISVISENASRKPNRQIPIFNMRPDASSKDGFAQEPKTPEFANTTPIRSEITGEDNRLLE